MLYSKNDIEYLKSIQSEIISKGATTEQKVFIQTLYRGIFHKELFITCKNCWNDSIIEILIFDKNNMADQLFRLKVGQYLLDAVHMEMDCDHRSLTDEKALYHIKKYYKIPGCEKLFAEILNKFSILPENWEDLVTGRKAEPVKEQSNGYESMTIKEIKALLLEKAYVEKDFAFKSREKLIEMLMAP